MGSVVVNVWLEISPTIQSKTNLVVSLTISKRVVTGSQGLYCSITPINRHLAISGEVGKTKAATKDPPLPELISLLFKV
jgi:hypothetical protein